MSDFRMTDTATYKQAVSFVAAAIVVVIILVVANIIRKNITPNIGGNQSHASRHLSIFSLRQLARNMGLDREQTKMLQFVFKLDGVTNPEQSLYNSDRLDSHFKLSYRHFMRTVPSQEELNNKLSLLFATRNVIEANSDNVETTSTRQIPENTPTILMVSKNEYPVRIISSKEDCLLVTTPVDSTGNPLHLLAGITVNLSFFAKTSKGFYVETRVLGHSKTAKGQAVLQLVHSGQIKRLSSRRYRRRQVAIATNFFSVYIEDVGRKKEKKMVVDKHCHSGSIQDISIGGCSIKTNAPVNSGSRLKIEFARNQGADIAALGQVLRTNKKGISTIMHVKFLKVPRNSLNLINGLVYGYAD
ncbi:MAG: PilZ domain-containing protein [Treponema sp.]|nr:PilZ domain-containing protein [Treponema sp.]